VVPADFRRSVLQGAFGAQVNGDYQVLIRFEPRGILHSERHWHPTQELKELRMWSGTLAAPFDIEEIERWVLSWGAHATVWRRLNCRRLHGRSTD